MSTDNELDEELREKIDKEITRSYVAGLTDGDGSIILSVGKDDSYKLDYAINIYIKFSRKQVFSIQLLDDWLIKNGINASVRQYENRYELTIGNMDHIERFVELMMPFIQDKYERFEILLQDLLPKIKEGYHRESKKKFIEIVEIIDEIRKQQPTTKKSQYTVDYFKEEWDME